MRPASQACTSKLTPFVQPAFSPGAAGKSNRAFADLLADQRRPSIDERILNRARDHKNIA